MITQQRLFSLTAMLIMRSTRSYWITMRLTLINQMYSKHIPKMNLLRYDGTGSNFM